MVPRSFYESSFLGFRVLVRAFVILDLGQDYGA